MLHTLAGLVKSQSHFFNVHPCLGIQQAIDTLAGKEFHLLITGMHLPEAEAFNLTLLMSANAGMRIIMMTHNASSELKEKIGEIGSVVHFNHARDTSMLTRLIFNALNIDFGGKLRADNLVAFLQIMEMEEGSASLLVTAKGRAGLMTILDGRPLSAKTGAMTGEKAALELLTWSNIAIDIDYSRPRASPEINTSLMNLLLEGGKFADDKRSRRKTLRRYRRYDHRRLAEFRVGKWTFQCCLHDISRGGGYIETDQPVKVGQDLELLLYSPSLDQSCDLNATVVRRDARGIGVRFEPLSDEQKRLLRLIMKTDNDMTDESPG